MVLVHIQCWICTVECHYNAVQYNTISHTALHWLKQNINQSWITNYNPYLDLMGELWGVFYEYSVGNWPCFSGTTLYFLNSYTVVKPKSARMWWFWLLSNKKFIFFMKLLQVHCNYVSHSYTKYSVACIRSLWPCDATWRHRSGST